MVFFAFLLLLLTPHLGSADTLPDWNAAGPGKSLKPAPVRKRALPHASVDDVLAEFRSVLKRSDFAAAERLLDAKAFGFSVDSVDSKSRTTLFATLERPAKNHLAVVQFLLAHNADVNLGNAHAATPLMIAAGLLGDRVDLARKLLAHGAEVNRMDIFGVTAFSVAVRTGNKRFSHLLADTNRFDNSSSMYLTPSGSFKQNEAPLQLAASVGDNELVQKLLDHGANIMEQSGVTNESALMAASAGCFTTTVLQLMRYAEKNVEPARFDAFLNTRDFNRYTAAMLAARFCCVRNSNALKMFSSFPDSLGPARNLHDKKQTPETTPLDAALEFTACPDNARYLSQFQ